MNTSRILTIGECMVEMAPLELGLYVRNFAGDTFNTAYYLRQQLGDQWQIDYASAVGTDPISDEMLRFMQEARIGTTHIRRIADRTVGLYMIELTNGERSFIYWRGQSAAKLLAADRHHLDHALEGATLVLISGITLAVLSNDDRQQLLHALRMAKMNGTVIAFDPNMRRRLWSSLAEMCHAVTEAASISDIVLPSFDEDSASFGDSEPIDTVRRYRDLGVGTVVVKNGAGTVLAWDGRDGEATYQPPPVTEVVDTTAAGDSFNAAFLAAGLKGAGLEDALKEASALAAKVIGKRGALVEL